MKEVDAIGLRVCKGKREVFKGVSFRGRSTYRRNRGSGGGWSEANDEVWGVLRPPRGEVTELKTVEPTMIVPRDQSADEGIIECVSESVGGDSKGVFGDNLI